MKIYQRSENLRFYGCADVGLVLVLHHHFEHLELLILGLLHLFELLLVKPVTKVHHTVVSLLNLLLFLIYDLFGFHTNSGFNL